MLIGIFAASTTEAQRNVVVVRPKEIHDVLVNPGMGITTFQRFNGQEPKPAAEMVGSRTRHEIASSGYTPGFS